MKQDWHDLMATLAAQASDLELLQLRTALDHLMLQPTRTMAIRRHLHVGQVVDYLDVRANQLRKGRVIDFRPDQVMVENAHDLARRWMPYAAIEVHPYTMPAQAPAPVPVPGRLRREDFAPGDTVSFKGRDLIRKFGTIRRTNQETASIACEDALEWRVSFGLPQRVISVEGAPLSLIVGPDAQDPDRPLLRKDLVHHAVLNIDAA